MASIKAMHWFGRAAVLPLVISACVISCGRSQDWNELNAQYKDACTRRDYSQALDLAKKKLALTEAQAAHQRLQSDRFDLANAYFALGSLAEAEQWFRAAFSKDDVGDYGSLASSYLRLGQPDSALHYAHKAVTMASSQGKTTASWVRSMTQLATIEAAAGQKVQATHAAREIITLLDDMNRDSVVFMDDPDASWFGYSSALGILAYYCFENGDIDSGLACVMRSNQFSRQHGMPEIGLEDLAQTLAQQGLAEASAAVITKAKR